MGKIDSDSLLKPLLKRTKNRARRDHPSKEKQEETGNRLKNSKEQINQLICGLKLQISLDSFHILIGNSEKHFCFFF